jgi:protocatechuate 3,4-dioxygenase beta subunit
LAVIIMLAAGFPALAQQEAPGADGPPVGGTVLVQGRVLDTDGAPVAGARVELWQADRNGNYDHPRDVSRNLLLKEFQYFGISISAEDGAYAFRTKKPSPYGSRPPHFHFKVRIDGRTVLTSQFYFPEDQTAVQRDGVFGNAGEALFLSVRRTAGSNGESLWAAERDIVLDLNGSKPNRLSPTPRQAEGPYYPVVDFSRYDSDLTRAAIDNEPVRPLP